MDLVWRRDDERMDRCYRVYGENDDLPGFGNGGRIQRMADGRCGGMAVAAGIVTLTAFMAVYKVQTFRRRRRIGVGATAE